MLYSSDDGLRRRCCIVTNVGCSGGLRTDQGGQRTQAHCAWTSEGWRHLIRESAVSEAAISGDSFHFVNFDWAGGEGIARYPVLLDNDITDLQPVSFIMSGDWPPGVVPCGIITPALDEDIMTTSIHELMGQGPRFCWTDAIL